MTNMTHPTDNDQEAAKRELAFLLAKVKAMTNEESIDVFTFDRALIPTLGAGEIIEVKVRRTHKNSDPFPFWDMAGVVEYVTP